MVLKVFVEQLFLDWLKEYGYIVLFAWSILEGELGLIMAGIMSHTGDMFLPFAIFGQNLDLKNIQNSKNFPVKPP